MQVTQVRDHVTHAVIGGGQAMSFGMSDSAEFFNILSNTLYSDKILAVVREVLCNAWDAHIESGRTDQAVQVILTDKELTFRDFGTGIPKEAMHQVYCVYGNSTKKHDGKQTGGFGLGCKAPFAYTDHFEVTSFNGGFMTIYRISKSSGEVGGRPGMIEVVSLPTTETGLKVKINIADQHDTRRFREVIQRIAAFGEMNVHLNNNPIETIPFSEAKQGFLITKADLSGGSSYQKIYVRYGNVIYPVENNEAYKNHFNKSEALLRGLDRYSLSWRLVLLAQPNTISVTPSRESLSMTDFTIETLRQLLENFHKAQHQELQVESLKVADTCIQQTHQNLQPALLLNTERKVLFPKAETFNELHLTDFGQIAKNYVLKEYPDFPKFRQQDMTMRLQSLIQSGFGNRGKIQSFLKEYTKNQTGHPEYIKDNSWFHRRLVAPLVMDLKKDPDLAADRLLVYSNKHESRRYRSEIQFVPAQTFKTHNFENYLPFLRNLLIITHNRSDITNRLPDFPEMKHWFGDVEDNLIYVVQRSDTKIEAARKLFTQHGFYVLDLTVRQKWEHAPIREVTETVREYKPRKKGIPVLSCLIPEGAMVVSTDWAKAETADRIENPEFVIKIGYRINQNTIGDSYSATLSTDIVKLFGSKGGICVNDTQCKKYTDQGAKLFADWVFDHLMNELKSNARIHHYMGVNPERLSIGYTKQSLVNMIMKDQVLRRLYDVDHAMTRDDFRYLRLWDHIERYERYGAKRTIVDETKKFLEGFPMKSSMKSLVSQISKSEIIDTLNADGMATILQQSAYNEQQRTKVRDVLTFIIKG